MKGRPAPFVQLDRDTLSHILRHLALEDLARFQCCSRICKEAVETMDPSVFQAWRPRPAPQVYTRAANPASLLAQVNATVQLTSRSPRREGVYSGFDGLTQRLDIIMERRR